MIVISLIHTSMFYICALVTVFILLRSLEVEHPGYDDTGCYFSEKKMLNLSVVRILLTESFTPG